MVCKKITFIINILVLSLILTSCADSRELDELGIIMSTGIDFVDGKVLVTNEVMMPSSSPTKGTESKSNSVIYLQHEGKTIFEALRNATLTFDRKLFLSHNRVLIFGEEFARRGIGDYINFYDYDSEPRESAYLLVAKGAKAYEVMGINEGLSDAPGRYLESLVENYIYTSKTSSITLNEYNRYFFETKAPVLGVVERIEKRVINKERADESQKDSRLVLNVEGGAAFYKDSLIGYYTGEEMIGFNFIVDEIEGGLIVFEVPDKYISPDTKYTGTKGKYTVLEIKKNKTKKDIQIDNGKITLNIDVKLKGVIGEETKGLRLTEPEVKDAIETACSEKVKEYINMALEKGQKELKVDTFSINTLFHQQYPELWRSISNDWESIFTSIDCNVNVETNIIRTGLIDIPTNIEKGDKSAY